MPCWDKVSLAERKIHISAGGALGLAGLVFLMTEPFLVALLAAAAAHEAGHVLALRLCGGRVVQIRVELGGLCLMHTALCRHGEEAFAALAGPAAGLLWSAAMTNLWPLSAGLSLLLSIYNLLPALPLDGGRALLSLTGRRALLRLSGALCAAVMAVLAIWAPLPLLLLPALRLWLEAFKA